MSSIAKRVCVRVCVCRNAPVGRFSQVLFISCFEGTVPIDTSPHASTLIIHKLLCILAVCKLLGTLMCIKGTSTEASALCRDDSHITLAQ